MQPLLRVDERAYLRIWLRDSNRQFSTAISISYREKNKKQEDDFEIIEIIEIIEINEINEINEIIASHFKGVSTWLFMIKNILVNISPYKEQHLHSSFCPPEELKSISVFLAAQCSNMFTS